jgi:hypothetical protein
MTRRDAFDPLIALAKARVVELAGDGSLVGDDAWFLARALFDLEADGVGLFGEEREADDRFYAEVADYLAARVGPAPVRSLALGGLENKVLALVNHSEVKR